MAKIGAKLAEMRKRRNLGLRELAARSGVSHSTISLIERDKMSPSVDTLSGILDALGTTLTGFFLDVQSTMEPSPFYASDDLVEIRKGADISYKMIGINHPDRQILLLYETYAVGADSGHAYSHQAQEAGMVLKGEVELTVDGKSRVLKQGDGYYFDSRLPHRFRNLSKEPCEVLSACTPPTY